MPSRCHGGSSGLNLKGRVSFDTGIVGQEESAIESRKRRSDLPGASRNQARTVSGAGLISMSDQVAVSGTGTIGPCTTGTHIIGLAATVADLWILAIAPRTEES